MISDYYNIDDLKSSMLSRASPSFTSKPRPFSDDVALRCRFVYGLA
jgi:hypothetical protein